MSNYGPTDPFAQVREALEDILREEREHERCGLGQTLRVRYRKRIDAALSHLTTLSERVGRLVEAGKDVMGYEANAVQYIRESRCAANGEQTMVSFAALRAALADMEETA